jgi:hypothetical protein
MRPESREEVAVASGQTISVCNMAEPETRSHHPHHWRNFRLLAAAYPDRADSRAGENGTPKMLWTIGLSHSTAVTGIEDAKRLSFDDPYCSVRG